MLSKFEGENAKLIVQYKLQTKYTTYVHFFHVTQMSFKHSFDVEGLCLCLLYMQTNNQYKG
jgi:hypothetical protein